MLKNIISFSILNKIDKDKKIRYKNIMKKDFN